MASDINTDVVKKKKKKDSKLVVERVPLTTVKLHGSWPWGR